MRREEKRRKFNEGVLNFLYPPPPLPSQSEEEEDPRSPSPAELKGDPFPGSSSESDDDGEDGGGQRKLTRAQRKKVRKKKLREESALRGGMIGPLNLLPSVEDAGSGKCNVQKDETSDVQRNARVDSASYEHQGDAAASTKQKRLKHRRVAKRLAKDSPASSNRREDE